MQEWCALLCQHYTQTYVGFQDLSNKNNAKRTFFCWVNVIIYVFCLIYFFLSLLFPNPVPILVSVRIAFFRFLFLFEMLLGPFFGWSYRVSGKKSILEGVTGAAMADVNSTGIKGWAEAGGDRSVVRSIAGNGGSAGFGDLSPKDHDAKSLSIKWPNASARKIWLHI